MGGYLKISYYYAEMVGVCSLGCEIPAYFLETDVCRDGPF